MKTTVYAAVLLAGLLSSGHLGAQTLDPTLSPPSATAGAAPAATAPPAARTTAAWTTLASMSTARAQPGVVAHPNGNIYVFGGYNGSTTFSSTEAYNVATDTWTSRAAMPQARQGMACAVGRDGNIYTFASRAQGIGYRSECYRYNPAADTWTAIASMPVARWQARAVTAPSGLIYVFGGWNADQSTLAGAEVQIYDPAANSWTLGTPMPARVMGMGAALDVTGRVHLYGGMSDTNPYPPLTSHYIYNLATNSWTTGPDLPAPARGYTTGAAGADGNLYILGGDSDIAQNMGTMYSNVDTFSPLTNAWSAGTALPVALTELGAVAMGDYVYVLGGLTGSNAPSAAVYRTSTPLVTTTWTGGVSTDWYTAGNWSNGVPDVTKYAVVPGGRSRYPVIGSGTATARKMTLNAGARLNLNGGRLDLVDAAN
ncbi:Kelch repeat-containing protein [Hymenobacter jeollabukensis]|nr:kelch repeat-containing protein [Hymenobacter jeollabukensis]